MEENEIVVDQDLIRKLVEIDSTFMTNLGMVKERIIAGLNDYADSLGDIEAGFFSDIEEAEIMEAKETVLDSWHSLQDRLNVDLTAFESFTDSMDQFKELADDNEEYSFMDSVRDKADIDEGDETAEGVFDEDLPQIIVAKFGDDAIDQIKTLSGIKTEETESALEEKGSMKTVGKNLTGVMGLVMSKLGITLPTWLNPSMVKSLGGAGLLAGGLLWAVMDGIKGFLKADEWGTSKVSSVLGGILGGTGDGLKGAFTGMGKYAMIGAGIGLLGGPVGVLAGGLIGAAIGGLLGWIGGEKIANTFDKIGAWFSEKWGELTAGFSDGVLEGIGYFIGNLNAKFLSTIEDLWIGIKEFFTKEGLSKAWKGIKDFHEKLTGFIGEWLSDAWDNIKNWWKRGKKGFDKGQEAEIVKDLEEERVAQAKAIASASSGTPLIAVPEFNQSETEEAIKKSNELLARNAEAQQKSAKEQYLASQEQIELLKQLVEKPTPQGGDGGIALDMGGIREATTDSSHSFRLQYRDRG